MKNVREWTDDYLKEEFEISELNEEAEFIGDLELSSLEVFTLLADLEYDYEIKIPEKLIRQMVTVRDMREIVERLIDHE